MKLNNPNINHEKIEQKRRKRTIWFLVTTTIILISLTALYLVKPDLLSNTFSISSEDTYQSDLNDYNSDFDAGAESLLTQSSNDASQEQSNSITPEKSDTQDTIQESQSPYIENEPKKAPDTTPPSTSVTEKSPPEASATTEGNRVVTFNDLALEQGIRKILEKETGDIFIRDINNINHIKFIGPFAEGITNSFVSRPDSYRDGNNESHDERGDIKSLSDLLVSPNFEVVQVSWQNEFDINSLYGFKIKDLSLYHNSISNISALSSVEKLTDLRLSFNNISDISPLANLSLNRLLINHNNITDIEPLSNMSLLTDLDISSNPITDINPLKNLVNLTYLGLSNVKANDFSILKNMTKLQILTITNNNFSDLSVLENNTSLKYLLISENDISDLSPIKNFKDLEFLEISYTKIHDLSVLRELPKLHSVSMYGVKLDDESIIDELSHINFMR